jgi:hypothetical protein
MALVVPAAPSVSSAGCAAHPTTATADLITRILGPAGARAEPCAELEPIADAAAWCDALLEDFPGQRGVEHIAPIAHSDRYDDPVFAPWQAPCPALPLNAILYPWNEEDYSEPEGQDLAIGFSTRDFRLYEVDFDGRAATPPTALFFGEAAYDYWRAVRRFDLPLALPSPHLNWNAVLPPTSVPNQLAHGRGAFVAVDTAACTVELAEIAGYRPLEDDVLQRLLYGGADMFYNRRLSGLFTYRGRTVFYALSWVAGRHQRWAFYASAPSHRGARPWPATPICKASNDG